MIKKIGNQRKINNGYWKILESSFYLAKIINSITYEIFGLKRFKHAFINWNLTLNRCFNKSVFNLDSKSKVNTSQSKISSIDKETKSIDSKQLHELTMT